MTADRELLLITGGAGFVGRLLAPELRRQYRLRLLDTETSVAVADDEVVQGDICDPAIVETACRGASGIVHLAAQPTSGDFLTALVPSNVVGTWSVFEAAVRAGVPRLVFASTVQTTDGAPSRTTRTLEMAPRPVSLYACTKLFGEAAARYYADRHGLSVACLRMGWVVSTDSPMWGTDPNLPRLWCDPGDLGRLVLAALHADVDFATVNAVSPPASDHFDTANPFGWQPTATMPRRSTIGPLRALWGSLLGRAARGRR